MCNWSETGDVRRSDAPVSQSESGGDSDDAIEHGGSTIEIAGEETASGYRLAVSDDGPGIPTHQQDEAFGLFDKGDDSDGTGIALAVCEQTVNRHNGDIRVESTGSSRPGRGVDVLYYAPGRVSGGGTKPFTLSAR